MEKHNEKSWGREILCGVMVAVISSIILAHLGLGELSGTHRRDPPPRPPVDVDATKLIGSWQANFVENGIQVRALWHLQAEGKLRYQLMSNRGSYEFFGTWQYSNGVIYERHENGGGGKEAIKWIDNNHIEVTILDNRGMKLQYYRY